MLDFPEIVYEDRKILHDISADGGDTWKTVAITPTQVLDLRACGYLTRPHFGVDFWDHAFADMVRYAEQDGHVGFDLSDRQTYEEFAEAFKEKFGEEFLV